MSPHGSSGVTVAANARPSTLRMVTIVAVLGACFVAIREGLPYAPVLWFAALRALLAGAVLAGLGLGQRRRLPRGLVEWAVIAGLGLANGTIVGAAMWFGTVHLATGIASVVANAQPLLIVLPAWALYGERPTRRAMAGLAVGFAGLVIVAIPGGGGSGAAIELVAAAGATAGTLLARRLGAQDNIVAGGWSFLLGGAALALWADLAEGAPAIRWTPRFAGSLAFIGVLGTALVYVLWFREARRCPLYRLAAWTFAVPLFGLALAVALEHERPGAWTVAGLSVVLASMWLLLRDQKRPAPGSTGVLGAARSADPGVSRAVARRSADPAGPAASTGARPSPGQPDDADGRGMPCPPRTAEPGARPCRHHPAGGHGGAGAGSGGRGRHGDAVVPGAAAEAEAVPGPPQATFGGTALRPTGMGTKGATPTGTNGTRWRFRHRDPPGQGGT